MTSLDRRSITKRSFNRNMLRKTIEGHSKPFDRITFEKIMFNRIIFVYDRTTNIQFRKSKMQLTGHWLRNLTAPNVTTFYTEKLQGIKFAFILFVANLTWSFLIF